MLQRRPVQKCAVRRVKHRSKRSPSFNEHQKVALKRRILPKPCAFLYYPVPLGNKANPRIEMHRLQFYEDFPIKNRLSISQFKLSPQQVPVDRDTLIHGIGFKDSRSSSNQKRIKADPSPFTTISRFPFSLGIFIEMPHNQQLFFSSVQRLAQSVAQDHFFSCSLCSSPEPHSFLSWFSRKRLQKQGERSGSSEDDYPNSSLPLGSFFFSPFHADVVSFDGVKSESISMQEGSPCGSNAMNGSQPEIVSSMLRKIVEDLQRLLDNDQNEEKLKKSGETKETAAKNGDVEALQLPFFLEAAVLSPSSISFSPIEGWGILKLYVTLLIRHIRRRRYLFLRSIPSRYYSGSESLSALDGYSGGGGTVSWRSVHPALDACYAFGGDSLLAALLLGGQGVFDSISSSSKLLKEES